MAPVRAQRRFRLVRCLGRGGFAQTYLAKVLSADLIHEYGCEMVAIKIPLDERKERALRGEVAVLEAMNLRLATQETTNLVRYLGFSVYDDQVVLVMEYVAGGSLRDRLGDPPKESAPPKRPMPIAQTIAIARGILSGLCVIHGQQIFHRDIKPENILMDGDTPRITDFGIARMLAPDDVASTTIGTLHYLSPEILCQGGASFPADVWAVGVTLYEMVAGRLPFGSWDTPQAVVCDRIRGTDPPPPSRISGAPGDLDAIILRALDRDPQRRPTSAQMLEALRTGRAPAAAEEDLEAPIKALSDAAAAGQPPEEVLARARELAAKHPSSARAQAALGQLCNRYLHHAEAVAAFTRAVECDPSDALLRLDLAVALQATGQPAKAVPHLQKALELGLDGSRRRTAESLLRVLGGKR